MAPVVSPGGLVVSALLRWVTSPIFSNSCIAHLLVVLPEVMLSASFPRRCTRYTPILSGEKRGELLAI